LVLLETTTTVAISTLEYSAMQQTQLSSFSRDYTEEPGADINVSHVSYQDAPVKALKAELTQTTGTAPLTVASTTKVSNLNSDLLDDQEGAWYSPPGMISMFAGSSAPSGWIICDGSAISRTTYANLFSAIGLSYGSGEWFNDIQCSKPEGQGSSRSRFRRFFI